MQTAIYLGVSVSEKIMRIILALHIFLLRKFMTFELSRFFVFYFM